jgi:hypothetical protein
MGQNLLPASPAGGFKCNDVLIEFALRAGKFGYLFLPECITMNELCVWFSVNLQGDCRALSCVWDEFGLHIENVFGQKLVLARIVFSVFR